MSRCITRNITLHDYLDREIWYPDELKSILEIDRCSVNRVKRFETPLMRILKNYQCSGELISLLLENGAKVHRRDRKGFSPLLVSLMHSRDEAVTRLLLEKGATVQTWSKFGESPLCVALRQGTTTSVVRLLLDAGCRFDECSKHSFALRCATSPPFNGAREDILKVLIEKGENRNRVDSNGESLLCRAHRLGAEAHHIKAMLDAGIPLNNCRNHSPLVCVLGDNNDRPFKASIVKVLLDAGADEHISYELLEYVLGFNDYDVKAIELLLATPNLQVNSYEDFFNPSPMEDAISNPQCKLRVLKMLIDKGTNIHHVNIGGDTFLHTAVNVNCRAEIFKFLLKYGCPVNGRNTLGYTPLLIAVENQRDPWLLQLLLNAGALVTARIGVGGQTALEIAIMHYLEEEEGSPGTLKILLKYFFLQNPACNIDNFILQHQNCDVISYFGPKYAHELREMEASSVGRGLTLRQWLLPQVAIQGQIPRVQNFDFDMFLKVVEKKKFIEYFDVIVFKADELKLKKKLQGFSVYAETNSLNVFKEKATMPYDCALVLSNYLEKEDFLSLIMAYSNLKDNDHDADEKKSLDQSEMMRLKRPRMTGE